jgi:hypothetical protein
MCIGSFVGSRRLSMEQKTHTTQQKKGEDEPGISVRSIDLSKRQKWEGSVFIHKHHSYLDYFIFYILCSLLIRCLFF